MPTIPLTQGKVTIIDEADYDYLLQWKWHYREGYAVRSQYLGRTNGKQKLKNIWMHRLLLNTPDGMESDHIDGNGLNNVRSNLRICTADENRKNRRPQAGGTSKYKGVYWHVRDETWCASIGRNGKLHHLGLFKEEDQAAIAYNDAALKYYGKFANLNIINL